MKYFYLNIILISFLLLHSTKAVNEIEIASTRQWCWTKPVINDPSFILNPNNGGMNWGFCKMGNISSSKKIEYFVYVSTSTLPESESTSKITIILQGTDSSTKEITLSNNGFKLGSYEKIKLFAEDVGNLQSIKLINKGKQQYRCNSIRIESQMNYWNFECDQPLKYPKSSVELFVVNLITYDITVKTNSMEDSGTSIAIYIIIMGTNGNTPKKLLSDKGFDTGTTVQVSIDTKDVGNLYGIILSIDGYDNWRPEEIIVKKNGPTGNEEKIFKNSDDITLSSPDKSMTLKIPRPDSSEGEDDTTVSNSNSLLNSNDLQKVIKLSCVDILKDNENFGPSYVTSNVNYMMFLAECPSDCMRLQVKAIGLGIHPEESPICINALIDKAVSFYGGIISVSIYKGLPSYTGGKKIFSIPVLGFGESKRSYSVAKVDNVDMISKDVRILDSEGKTTYRGRIEVRNEGIWGTVCAVGMDNSAAKVICKQIGYKEGKFLNPNETKGKGFCANYEGVNYCGVPAAPILFSHMNCQGNEESIMDCYRKMADKAFCTHDYDALIECANTETEEYVSFDNGTVRLIDSLGSPTQTGIGRLEILRGNWGSVCNTKFTDKSAQVVCKQMSYLDGKLYGQQDSSDSCGNVLGHNLCGDFIQPIKLTEVICDGHEKSLKDCKSNSNTVSCNHFKDVILKCEGYGDSSGKSQNIKKPKVLNPLIEKLPMPPTFNAKCDTVAKLLYFRGDPGSIFLVNCPIDCANMNYSVTGVGVYSIDSSICRAAIQSGIITNEGGNVVVVKTYGQNKYYAANLRSVSSLESNYLKVSFFPSAPNSAILNMIAMINNGSFLEISKDEYYLEKAIFKKHFLQYSSFIETNSSSNEIKALYEWTSPNNEFRFDGIKDFLDLYLIEASRIMLEKKTFTLFSKIRMIALGGSPQTILSIGGCEGFSIIIETSSELSFDVKCGSLSYKSGIFIPLNYDSSVSIVFEGSKILFYLDGIKYNETSCYFNLQYKPKIVIGKNSEYDNSYFHGKIYNIAFFGEALGPKRNARLYSDGYIKPDKIITPKFITLDNRNCITPCANQPTPGLPGSPIPPPEAVTFEINGDKTVISGNISGSRTDSSEVNDLNPFKEIKCSTTANELFPEDIKVGDKIRVKCPSDCKKNKGSVYGTIIYSFDSVICNSAMHSGILKDRNTMVMIKILPGMTFYQGTLQYEIQSTSIDNSKFSFSIEEAPPVITIDCKTSAASPQFSGTIGMKFLVKCPTNCSKIPHNVFGNESYSADSSICQSSIHSGALNDRGGEVQFIIEPGKKVYFGNKAYGIDSKERDSYVKSIKFFNANNNLFVKFKEDFKSQYVTKNWEIVDNLEANDYPSKWEFVQAPSNLNTNGEFLIHQAKKIRSESLLSYGSILSLRNADVVNSLYKISFYFINMSPVGVIFRYKDENNYYHLRINNVGSFKIILIKRYEGKSITLATVPHITITPRLWYTFTLYIYYDKFQVNLQIGDLRNNQLLIESSDNDIQKGGLGIGTDGNDDFYAKGIYIDNYDLNNSHAQTKAGSDVRTFDTLIRENTENHRKKYCKSNYEGQPESIQDCNEFHNYCKLRCDQLIHRRENILNFNCYKTCVKDSLMKEKIKNMMMDGEIGYGINPGIWTPKEKEKCDFKPDDLGSSSTWVPCYITEVKNNPNDPEQRYIQVKYKLGDFTKIATILYPNITLKKCGSVIKTRDDCSKSQFELPIIKD